MDEGNVKETATAYTVLSTRLAIPPEWNWLRNFSAEDRAAFFQEIMDIIATARQPGDWTKLSERVAAWKKRAEANEQQALAELRQQFVKEGGLPEIASLLGKYRGQLSSVDEFIRNKQSEKSLER